MLKVEQFLYSADNFAYLVHGDHEALAIDGGAWQEIISFIGDNNLRLKYVTNTHTHHDHTSGNHHLIKSTGAPFLDSATLPDHHVITIDGEAIEVLKTPGHTDDSVCFRTGKFLIAGDTLFNATIGNCFSGNLKNFYSSVKRLMALPDETIVFAGHDYISDSLAFALRLEPDNRDIDLFRSALRSRTSVYSTLAEERKINPYFRFNEKPLTDLFKKNHLPHTTEWERWNSLMSIE